MVKTTTKIERMANVATKPLWSFSVNLKKGSETATGLGKLGIMR